MTEQMSVCYHGTDRVTATKIREEGFLPLTYFARHLEDAIGFGGEYVFCVAFSKVAIAEVGWQFQAPEAVPPDRIVSVQRYVVHEIFLDEALSRRIFDSNIGRCHAGGGTP